jgi:hypothetical protein
MRFPWPETIHPIALAKMRNILKERVSEKRATRNRT